MSHLASHCGEVRFNRDTPWEFLFRDPRFTEMLKFVAWDAVGVRVPDRLHSAAARYADKMLQMLRAGELPLVKVTPAMRKQGLSDEIAARVAKAVMDFARDHTHKMLAAAAEEKQIMAVLDSLDAAADGDELLSLFV